MYIMLMGWGTLYINKAVKMDGLNGVLNTIFDLWLEVVRFICEPNNLFYRKGKISIGITSALHVNK